MDELEQKSMDHDSDSDRHLLERSVSASEDFLCSCCYDLMVQPTTLTCGHSFCRLCIANWYFTSKKMECPQCRSPWTGNPQVNITLRKLMEKMYSDAVAERERETMNNDAIQSIAKFDAELTTNKNTNSRQAHGQGFCGGICFALVCIVVVYLSWYWRYSDKDLLVHKPLAKWTSTDVSQWLTDMGAWTQPYLQAVDEKDIVGQLLLGFDEESIDQTFNITDPLHKKALLNSIHILKEKGVKPPSNLWEFKALNPGWALFLLYGMKDFPRTMFVYLYFFEYETMFVPFIHVVCPMSENAPRYDFSSAPQPLSSSQWAEFLPKSIVMPYWLIAEFTWDWTDIHYWTSRFILVNCLISTLLEANYVTMYIRGQQRIGSFRAEIKKVLKSYLSIGIFVIIWPIVPSFVCDCFFYVAMYFSPYQAGNQIYELWRR